MPALNGTMTNGVKRTAPKDHSIPRSASLKSYGKVSSSEKGKVHSRHSSLQSTPAAKPKPEIFEKQVQLTLAKIEKMDEIDMEGLGSERERQRYNERRLKRLREVDEKESEMRKVRGHRPPTFTSITN